MVRSKEVSSWLYILIGSSLVFTLLLISKGLDRIAKPSQLRSPAPITQEEYDLPIRIGRIRNVHHIAPLLPRRFSSSSSADGVATPLDESGGRAPGVSTQIPDDLESIIQAAVDREKLLIEEDLAGYVLPDAGELSDHLMAAGGQPLRAMVVTTWRSGSTFLGDIMSSHPATYYHYEPLLHFDIKQARQGYLAQEAVRVLKSLMMCNYTNLSYYLEYGRTHHWLFNHNAPLWKYCTESGDFRSSYCWSPQFLNRFCPLFPFQSIKTVRLRLNLTREFMEDEKLNVKILLLVRDPRGTMQSRKHRSWCPGNPDCDDAALLCGDLVADYYAAVQLTKQYPDRYKVARYEDFSLDPYNSTVDLFRFFGFAMHPNVVQFLETHTTLNKGGVSSTFRDSKTAPFAWREKLTMAEVEDIQEKCGKAMKLWGYKTVQSQADLPTFSPVLPLETEFSSQP